MAEPKSEYVRRTEQNWGGLLGAQNGGRVAADERRRAMLRAVTAGATKAEIARHLGVSPTMVSTFITKAEREIGKPSVFDRIAKYEERQTNQAIRCLIYR